MYSLVFFFFAFYKKEKKRAYKTGAKVAVQVIKEKSSLKHISLNILRILKSSVYEKDKRLSMFVVVDTFQKGSCKKQWLPINILKIRCTTISAHEQLVIHAACRVHRKLNILT